MKKTNFFSVTFLALVACFWGCNDYPGETPKPDIPAPIVFQTIEASFTGEYEEETLAFEWYTYCSRDGKKWSLIAPANFREDKRPLWTNPEMIESFKDTKFLKKYSVYPLPTKNVLIKTFCIAKNAENQEIFLAVKTMPEDNGDSTFINPIERDLKVVYLRDSLKIGKIESIISQYGNKKIQVNFLKKKIHVAETALATYDSRNGLNYENHGNHIPDSCLIQINDGVLVYPKNLSEDRDGNIYLHSPEYGYNVELISMKPVKQ